ncbi:MAG: hypothetical protein DSZ21_00740 [Tenericutes bacterium]|nr:MAG: hypothetical protein DSZ21_00740 [Mycoplasmatota bacterium]
MAGNYSYAKEANVIEQCEQEIAKKALDIPFIKKVCLQAAKQEEANKQYGNASWYYLLAGELDYLIKEMPQYINPKTSTAIYANLAHAYVLKDQPKKAKEMYWVFLTLGGQNILSGFTSEDYAKLKKENDSFKYKSIGDIKTILQLGITDNPTQNDYQLLNKRYPLNNKSLKKGLQYWEQTNKNFFKVLQQVGGYLSKGDDSYNNGQYSTALNWFQKTLIKLQKVLGKEHPDTALSYNNVGFTYGKMGNYASNSQFEISLQK